MHVECLLGSLEISSLGYLALHVLAIECVLDQGVKEEGVVLFVLISDLSLHLFVKLLFDFIVYISRHVQLSLWLLAVRLVANLFAIFLFSVHLCAVVAHISGLERQLSLAGLKLDLSGVV